MNDFTFTKEAFEDYLYWQIQNKKTMKRINYSFKRYTSKWSHEGNWKARKIKISSWIFKKN